MAQSIASYFLSNKAELNLTAEDIQTLSCMQIEDERTDGSLILLFPGTAEVTAISHNLRQYNALRRFCQWANDKDEVLYRTPRSLIRTLTFSNEKDNAAKRDVDEEVMRRIGPLLDTEDGKKERLTVFLNHRMSHIASSLTREETLLLAAAVRSAYRKHGKAECLRMKDVARHTSDYGKVMAQAAIMEDTELRIDMLTYPGKKRTRIIDSVRLIDTILVTGESRALTLEVKPSDTLCLIMSGIVPKGKDHWLQLREPLLRFLDPLLPQLSSHARSLYLLLLDVSERRELVLTPLELKKALATDSTYAHWSDFNKRLLRLPAREIEEKTGLSAYTLSTGLNLGKKKGEDALPERVYLTKALAKRKERKKDV